MASPSKELRHQGWSPSALLAGWEALDGHPELAGLLAELLYRANQSDSAAAFLAQSLPRLLQAAGGDFVGVAASETGRWTVRADFGALRTIPTGLLAKMLDREKPAIDGSWVAVPLAAHAASGEVLAFCLPAAQLSRPPLEKLELLTRALGAVLETARSREHDRRRIERLEAILTIAGQWNQTNEMEPLLVQMAEAATRLLQADRASIFLWDRRTTCSSAARRWGSQGASCALPDSAGIVGQVVSTRPAAR